MSHSPKFHTRAGSRASLVSVGQMPVINEDSNPITISASPTTPTPPPPATLHLPVKNHRRSIGPPDKGTVMPYVVGFLAMPPGVLSPVECKDEGDDGYEDAVVGKMTLTPTVRSGDGRWDGEGWKSDDMKRRCHLVLIVAVIMVVLVGLTIGLSLGLTKTPVNDSQSSSRSSFPPGLPTGTFAFDTMLQYSSTKCTSDPSTWRCISSKANSPVRFYWTIAESSSGYQVSSSNDPIASSFSNVSLWVLDGGKQDERLTFSFKLNVTFETPITTTNRVAKCTYAETTFQATLWTKHETQELYNATQKRTQPGNWTGLVEVAEVKNATLGMPECVDSQGNEIADVQAEMGTCMCVYRTKGWQ